LVNSAEIIIGVIDRNHVAAVLNFVEKASMAAHVQTLPAVTPSFSTGTFFSFA